MFCLLNSLLLALHPGVAPSVYLCSASAGQSASIPATGSSLPGSVAALDPAMT
tara:strand:- start:80929 stop:81087 length:159 start_codon:yes stop_codon:yes gene_type:complete